MRAVVEAIDRRTTEIVDRLSALGEDDLLAASLLPGWSRLTIACHLRYGAEAFIAMTEATVRGEFASYYPAGRSAQRATTLEPQPSESAADVLRSLTARSAALHARWTALRTAGWELDVVEPDDNPDLGPVGLRDLPVFRLTEVEVHGTDLGLGLAAWSDLFVDAALPLRIERLARRQPLRTGRAAWLFEVADGESTLVEARDGAVLVSGSDRSPPHAQRVELDRRHFLALLLGRSARSDVERSFLAAFPGP